MAEEPEIKLPTSAGSLKKQENSRKTSTIALLTMPKPLTVWITTKCAKFGIPDHLTCLLRNLYAVQEATVRTGHGTTAAKSLQSCPTLCDSIDGSPPGSPVPGILQAILIPACASSSPAFCMMYSAYKLNK